MSPRRFPRIGREWRLPPARFPEAVDDTSTLLQESGDDLLLESGDEILLEDANG